MLDWLQSAGEDFSDEGALTPPSTGGRDSADGASHASHERYRRRYIFLIGVAMLAFLVLAGRLWYLQVLQGERYWRASTENIIRDIEIKPARGRIFDRHEVVLADNRPSYDVYLIPSIFNSKRNAPKESLARLTEILNLTADELANIEKLRKRNVAEVVVRRDVTRAQVAELEASSLDVPGVEVRANAHRYYPLHAVGAHALGFLGEIHGEELTGLERYGYSQGDYIGRMGLEAAFEDILRGSPGLDRVVVNARGEEQGEAETRFLIGEYQHVSPVSGRDLVLTLDTELMLIIDEAMRDRAAGAVVALDPRDGSILALYSKPSFNPNSWTGRLSRQEKQRNDSDPYKPMLDKTVNSYFPGSVFKIVGSLAALEEGLMSSEDEAYCPGYYRFGGRRFRCWKYAGHGHTNVMEALAGSCDVYYYKVAEQVGIDKVAEYAWRFGFGELTGIGINNESSGRIPTKEWHRKHSPDGYQYGFALNTIIGQGDTLTSPLQVALAYGAIANGGDLYYPRLIDEVRSRQGETLFKFESKRRKHVEMAPEHLAAIQRGLWSVVNEDGGTAYSVKLKDVEVAGKTGTAQVHKIGQVRIANRDKDFRLRDHAWFASYAPAENPEIVLIVFLQHGGHGGSDAAPVAMEIYEKYFSRDTSRPLTSRVSELAASSAMRERNASRRKELEETLGGAEEARNDDTDMASDMGDDMSEEEVAP